MGLNIRINIEFHTHKRKNSLQGATAEKKLDSLPWYSGLAGPGVGNKTSRSQRLVPPICQIRGSPWIPIHPPRSPLLRPAQFRVALCIVVIPPAKGFFSRAGFGPAGTGSQRVHANQQNGKKTVRPRPLLRSRWGRLSRFDQREQRSPSQMNPATRPKEPADSHQESQNLPRQSSSAATKQPNPQGNTVNLTRFCQPTTRPALRKSLKTKTL